jgi:hypothetical protein
MTLVPNTPFTITNQRADDFASKIKSEREQLVSHWKLVVAKWRDASSITQLAKIVLVANGGASISLNSQLRQLHNKFGYKVVANGLCAGAIFRTRAFVNTPHRVGTKIGQTIHIEHTVPVIELEREIRKRRFEGQEDALHWLLTHSVTTAFHISQTRYLEGVSGRTDAFKDSAARGKPFMRYKRLFDDGEEVWNVFDRRIIQAEEFTFEDHTDLIIRLLAEANASRSLIDELERRAMQRKT